MRFSRLGALYEAPGQTQGVFQGSSYSASAQGQLLYPYCSVAVASTASCPTANKASINPVTGAYLSLRAAGHVCARQLLRHAVLRHRAAGIGFSALFPDAFAAVRPARRLCLRRVWQRQDRAARRLRNLLWPRVRRRYARRHRRGHWTAGHASALPRAHRSEHDHLPALRPLRWSSRRRPRLADP